jgi:dual specificity tyrosine-phosphorylation-regulated kinase 2/3/4
VASIEGRSFLPTPASEATTRPNPNPTNPRYSFTPHAAKEPGAAPEPYEFLPAVNFDDFANSLAYEPALSDFPAPGGFKSSVPASASTPSMPAFTGATPGDGRPARSSSFIRRFSQSTARKPSSASTASASTLPSDASSMPPPTTNMAVRTRRQSQFPAQAPPNPAARMPRKSVGPGLLPASGYDGSSRLASDSTQTSIGRTPSLTRGTRRETLSSTLSTTSGVPKPPNPTRTAKAKSLQPPSRHQSGYLTASVSTPDSASMPLSQARSPGKSPAQRTQTPNSTSSKRQSTAAHISGLGARTISPTDARRLKRLSMNPNPTPPGGPVGPPTPQGDQSFDERAFTQSPVIPFVNSVTPSSARATPEQNRKSYASGISLSSNSSLNSLKVGGSSIPMRMPNLTLSTSRLPAPKPRNVHSSAGGEDEEEVPPVPAIPKAYESPQEPERGSFQFSSSSFQSGVPQPPPSAPPTTHYENHESRPVVERSSTEASVSDMSKTSTGSIRHRRGLTVGPGSEPDRTPTVQQSTKKNLQPIRLPPLNLLPLGTPFNNRISSFPAPSAEVDERNLTPPPKRATNKTPSTPMTASKASFFSKSNHHTSHDYDKTVRSSSSAYNLRAVESFAGPPAVGSMPISTLNPNRQTTTPFASNSLPKGSGEFARLQPRPSGEYHAGHKDVELQSMNTAPRLSQKDTSDSAPTSTSTEPETPSSGSSLRRKLSLSGWRRAPSKAASHPSQNPQVRKVPQKAEEPAPQPPRHGDMPPPRLPASATWSGAIGTSPTPATNRTRPSLDFGRRKTSTSTAASDTELEKPGVRKPTVTAGMRTLSGYHEQSGTHAAPKSSSSLLTPMQRMLGSKSSSNMLKSRNLDSNLDRDDLLADEEMKKLASKRKDFEHAARDVDELRKRAKPQERVTPSQALQMVNLNIFERGEIIDYKEIYFCGTKSAKKHVGDLNAQTANFGYDDERGDYNIVFGDHLAYRYEVVDLLGKGSFGQVVRCVDHKTGGLVAIKIIRNKKRFHQQALVEVNILQKLREWVS